MRLLSPSLIVLSVALASCTGKTVDNTLRLPMIADAKTLDPALVQDVYSNWMTSLSYEGLLQYQYLKRPFELMPCLAESMPEVSKDGLTYTFKIKKGVMFMDHAAFPSGKGRELKAKDFVYSFLRVADPKTNSGNFWVFDGRIEGFNEWRDKAKTGGGDYDHPPTGLQTPDDYTLKIKLTRKYPQLLYVLAMPMTFAVAREVVEKTGKDFPNTPVGTGPYKLVNWLRNSKLSFTKNPTYHGDTFPTEGEQGDKEAGLLDDAGKSLPFVEKLEYYVFVELQPEWLNFLKGSLDYVNIPKDNYESAIDKKTKELLPDFAKKGVHLMKAPQPEIGYTAFNMEDPVIKKGGAWLRKAISLANDEEKLIDLFFNGRALHAQFILPPAVPGYDANFVNPWAEHNFDKAKDALVKAGFPGGKGLPELVYEAVQGTEARQEAELLQKDLAEIGITMRVNYNQFAELDEKIVRKRAQMWGIAWMADYPDAENFLQLLYGPNSAPGPNGSNYNNPEWNKLYEQTRDMADSPQRRALIGKMRDIFVQDLPWVTERHRIFYYMTNPWLKNFKMEYMGGSIAKYLRIDMEQKKKSQN